MANSRLSDYAATIKSSNAGASWLTFDLRFDSREKFDLIVRSAVLSPELFHQLYQVPAESVMVYAYEPALTIKVTIPRAGVLGGVSETDFDGVQQFAPLLDVVVEVPDDRERPQT